ncbi:MAG: stage II sporulation protein M [Prevotella sp.]|nr:stage II sporulation protein M [Prevotella sp.]
MKEVTFIRQNIEKWRDVELMVENSVETAPDVQADAYIDLTSDLAYAQTHFPQSRITLYLNNLASALHNQIYRNKRESISRLVTFWTQEIPQTIWEARHALMASFIIFVISVTIGLVSQLGDDSFARLILGDQYVDMTLDNIAKGEPMAVYDSGAETEMFLGITWNNVKVSFMVFVMGVFTSLGTGFLLFQNGVMVGSFQTFFFQQGLGFESMLAIWLHGTLEIWAIIVSGAAGITLGNGWLMPGTYGRLTSFMMAARRGLKIIVGTVPIFVMAGFIEGFATRHTEWPTWLRLTIIGASALFIGYYYLYLPYFRNHARQKQ